MNELKTRWRSWRRRAYQNRQVARWRRTTRAQLARQHAAGHPIKLILGAGSTHYAGWLATDLPYLDALKPDDWQAILAPGMLARLVAEHVFEHLTPEDLKRFLHLVRPYLRDDGRIRIAVPDGNHPDPAYLEHVRPGGTGPGAEDHQVLYTWASLSRVIAEAGYAARPLEHFDAEGQFHQNAWDAADGFIQRSAAHDARNQAGELRYTSLIVDCWPVAEA